MSIAWSVFAAMEPKKWFVLVSYASVFVFMACAWLTAWLKWQRYVHKQKRNTASTLRSLIAK